MDRSPRCVALAALCAARRAARLPLSGALAGRATSIGLVALLVWAALPWWSGPVLAAPAPAVSGLHVSGNQILNASGQPVRLRGVNRTSGEYGCIFNFAIFEGPTNATAIQAMVNWKINAVRLPLNEDCWLDVNTGGIDRQYVGAAYRAAVADYVSRLTAAGIAVIVDLHWAAPGTLKADQQYPMANRDHSVAFWTSVADTFKSNSAVIFDLFNEPYPDNNRDTVAAWRCVRDGTTVSGSCPSVGYAAAGMQELLDAVRATGATNLVMVAGVAYSGVLSRWMEYQPTDSLDPPNIAASVHIYPPGSQCSTVACWDQYLGPLAAQYPLIAGEIGQSNCAHDRIDTVMDWMEAHGQHYLAWVWWTEGCGASPFYGLVTDYLTGAPTTGYGQGFKDRLATVVGAPTSTPTRPPTQTAIPSRTPTPAQTPTRTPTGTMPPAPGFAVSAHVAPASAAPGGSVGIAASVTSAAAASLVVDVEVHDAAEHAVYQAYFEDVAFAAGQTRTFPLAWTVPVGTAAGTYSVQIGVFGRNWGTMYLWDSDAGRIIVGTAGTDTPTPIPTRTWTPVPTPPHTPTATPTSTPVPTPISCTPRPHVLVTTRVVGPGQLEATVRSESLPLVPANALDSLTFGAPQNATVTLDGGDVSAGTPIPLGGVGSATFVVTRTAAGRASTVPLTVRDRCGDWSTFVGGGPDAF
jgi:hypothetical protein